MDIRFNTDGTCLAIYAEDIPLSALGTLEIKRASNVEADPVTGQWWADLTPVGGPILGPFAPDARSKALAAEVAWLHSHLIEVHY